jgi:hypothetical protein
MQIEPDWDLVGQLAPDYEIDQHVNWCEREAVIQTRCARDLHQCRTESLFALSGLLLSV